MSEKQGIEIQKNIDVEVVAQCAECGEELEIELSEHSAMRYTDRADILAIAKPCASCLAKAKDEGIEQGKAEAAQA